MTNTQTVRIDLTSPGGFAPVIHAVAGDIYSRFVRMELYQNGVLYEPPSGTTCVIGWRRGETYGAYSSILEEDGSSSHPAWELEDNVLTIELDWHVCQHPGDVAVNVSLNGEGGSRLHTWELCCRVARGAVADADDPTKPSESATDAANRAEAAAAEAQDSAADLADAVKRAEEPPPSAPNPWHPPRALSTASTAKAAWWCWTLTTWARSPPLPRPQACRPGMLLTVKEVTAEGNIITEAVEPPNDAGFVEINENIPAEQRKAGVLYGLVVMDLSAETEPATFNN